MRRQAYSPQWQRRNQNEHSPKPACGCRRGLLHVRLPLRATISLFSGNAVVPCGWLCGWGGPARRAAGRLLTASRLLAAMQPPSVRPAKPKRASFCQKAAPRDGCGPDDMPQVWQNGGPMTTGPSLSARVATGRRLLASKSDSAGRSSASAGSGSRCQGVLQCRPRGTVSAADR